MSNEIKIGSRVTGERPTWHDGSPVVGWPTPASVGVVKKIEESSGLLYAEVVYPKSTGRAKRRDLVSRWYLVING